MPKLDQRKRNCLKQMQDDPQNDRTVSTEPDQANVVEVRKNDSGGYTAVAKSDVDVGRVVVVEEPFNKYLLANFDSICNICLKECGNLVPCDICADAMFCPDCKGDALHDYECGLNSGSSDLNSVTKKIIRSILQTLKVFPVVDDLMAFVEQRRTNSTEWPAKLVDDRSKYQVFFGTAANISHGNVREAGLYFDIGLHFVYTTLIRIPKVAEMFHSTKYQRFLLHLIPLAYVIRMAKRQRFTSMPLWIRILCIHAIQMSFARFVMAKRFTIQ